MSFGFGGFGQNNQSSGFGAGSGFGGTSSGGGFGAGTQNQSNSLFGSQNRTGGFGTGTSTGGSLFGGGAGATTATTTTPSGGFGGFGSTGNTGGFGSSNNTTGGGLFGNKTATGTGTGTGTGFGSSTGTTGGFGTSGGFGSGTAGFGSGSGTAFQQAVPPSDGTGSTPFSPFTEKDGNTSVTNHYQSISFMQPYNKYSFEELRLGDYQQGRRFGNGSGQAGAFGTSAFGGSGFGQQQQSTGFGSTSSPFGGTSAPAFGQTQTQTTGGFGSTSSNPLFGSNKPATSLFGGGATSTGTSQSSLFGGATATSGGFGNTANTGAGFGTGGTGGTGGLFGNNTTNNQQQQQNKSLFGGGGASTGAGFGGFGQQNTSTSTPFGGTAATSSPFGGGQQQQQTTGGSAFGGFGQQNQQNQTQTQNKGLFGGFGQNNQQQQSSTPSLFGGGAAPTGSSSLFGQNNQQPSTGTSLFGGGNQQPGTGSLFGGGTQQQGQKSSLFGSGTTGTPTATNTFGGFGNTQNQQTGTGGLFNTQNQQQQKPSLFGGSTGTGGSLFGGGATTTQNTGSSLFGNTQNQQQPQTGGLGMGTSSLFGNTQQTQAQQQQPQQPVPGSLQASLLDPNPYGNQSIFSGLPAPSAPSPGPLATPLASSIKQKQRTPLPVYKITPNAANRLVTPPKRQGYGFSYSTYGSPSSSTGTPGGLGNSLLGGSLRGSVNGGLGRASFSKSFSTSNLRKTFDPETDSVLSPGALSSGSSRLSSGNLKRLTIDRSLRNDLFSRPASTPAAAITNCEDSAQPTDKAKKKVSFESTSDATTGGEIVPVQSQPSEPTPEELGFLRSIRKSNTVNGLNGIKENGTQPEMESVRDKDLPAVPEDSEQTAVTDGQSRLAFVPSGDPQPGEYWMKPTRAELNKMGRDQLKHVVGFTVGRQRCGQVTFDEPVDLTNIDLDQIFGGLVDIGVRKITVYPDEAIKPPRGKGLNVPSILRIENSWPRGRDKKSPSPLTSGPLFEKHVDRLRKVHNTEFIDYETETGTWVFKVPHYTTYGLDYDSDDDDEGESLNQSTLSAAPDTPTPKAHTPTNLDNTVASEQMSTFSTDDSFLGSVAGVDDDTFDFKKRKLVPGSFGNQAMVTMEDEHSNSGEDEESFLGEGSTGSTTEQEGDDVTESQHSGESEVELDEDEEMDMAGTFPSLHHTVERDDTKSIVSLNENTQPSLKPWSTPPKARLDLSGDWAAQLQRTISPRKQDRDALREIQANAFTDRALHDDDTQEPVADTRQKGFATSIDLMNSLFQQPRKQQTQSPSKARNTQPRGFEWPYNKKPKTFAGDANELSQDDLAFHHSFKPRWGPADSIICVKNGMGDIHSADGRWEQRFSITSEERDITLLASNESPESNVMLDAQKKQTTISHVDDVPLARLTKADFQQFAQTSSSLADSDQERLLWQLVNILFNDEIEDDISAGVPPQLRSRFIHRIKKDRLSRLWEGIVREKHAHTLGKASSAEEQAIYLLCSHRVEEACNVLIASQNLHLATLIAQIGRDPTSRADMAKQIEMWQQHNVYSEMTEPIRALYELLAGNALRSEGKSGGALEDRASTFTLTERFGLDWIQAFGLRLWYGVTDDEPIEAAVSKFLNDLGTGNEPAFPHPFRQESARELSHSASDTLGQESPLWVLLKLYSMTLGAAKDIPVMEFPAALLPESVSGDKLSNRLSFQLYQLLATAVGQHDGFQIDTFHVDQMVYDYAWELSRSDQLDQTLFVLLHLSRSEDRERAVKETLARFASRLPDPATPEGAPDTTWHYLTTDLQIPEGWIWVAKALYARDTGDAAREVDCLVRGNNWDDAHATFCRIVGPTAVIERDYATLEKLVSGFGEAPERKVRGWTSGGGVYEDFLRLATAKSSKRDATRLNRLVNALVAMGNQISQGSGVEGLEERVAFKEMSRAIASWTAHEDSKVVEFSSVLSLPLTGDARIMQTAEMSRRYYGIIMAGAY
ncbi:nuclear protein 96-domain-containing protein [Aspergillus pseudotamarii]|uniref:Nuclear protein 96-domain-containing protein n=1 Tax=Aspergillus pseudotamarii TaxID=132259 RepID=A0A5N6SIC8_ASPPS|nr:nuclear protein 96-domain-containing protein [Aspergillus pseudotamarii]KAE8133421.1 nuclear protein 96-domain-containing protein [Aspergillus pseudotamarii]